jgi:hypothetical protein
MRLAKILRLLAQNGKLAWPRRRPVCYPRTGIPPVAMSGRVFVRAVARRPAHPFVGAYGLLPGGRSPADASSLVIESSNSYADSNAC